MRHIASLFVLIIIVPLFTQATEDRGLQIIKIPDQSGQEVELYQESYALVIGVSEYSEWPNLSGVKKDIQTVTTALKDNGFHVEVVENPNYDELEDVFKDFINQYGQNLENRLLFYFSGHGHTHQLAYGGEMGYIVPADAPNPHYDVQGFLSKAMDMQMFESYAKRIQAKHALFIFDSCFSGSIFALSKAAPESISYKTAQPVRQFITSGSADEQVPDESVFRQQFIAALSGEGDMNEDGYVTGEELGYFLQDRVITYSKGSQHPQYGKIRDPILDKGDFVFKVIVEETPPEQALDSQEKAYRGQLISFRFQNADILDVLDVIAEVSGLNLVIHPGVTGTVTVHLTNVPWDQALDLVLELNNLHGEIEGNVIRVRPKSTSDSPLQSKEYRGYLISIQFQEANILDVLNTTLPL